MTEVWNYRLNVDLTIEMQLHFTFYRWIDEGPENISICSNLHTRDQSVWKSNTGLLIPRPILFILHPKKKKQTLK